MFRSRKPQASLILRSRLLEQIAHPLTRCIPMTDAEWKAQLWRERKRIPANIIRKAMQC